MSIDALYWREPLWLLLAGQPLLIYLLRRAIEKHSLGRYAKASLHAWVVSSSARRGSSRLLNLNTLYLLAWLCLAIAAAGPRSIEALPEQALVSGVDIMVVVDISQSMQAADITPSRLVRARQKLQALIDRLQHDRLGLIAYAAQPHLLMPLTRDKAIMQHFAQLVDGLRPPSQGSRPALALQLAEQQLAQQAIAGGRAQAILLLSDGDNSETLNTNTPVFVLGMGSIEGEAIPDYADGWIEVAERAVISRLEERALRTIADKSGGDYLAVQNSHTDLDSLYNNGILLLNKEHALLANDKVIWHEWYRYFLVPGILLLFLSTANLRLRPAGKLAIIFLLGNLLPVALQTPSAQANDTTRSAYQAFQDADYDKAQSAYQAVEGFHGRFGEGASAYRLQDSLRAIQSFKQAFLAAKNDAQRAQALYNLGNSYFQQGDYATAIDSYRDALLYKPDSPATQTNLQFSTQVHQGVQQRLARLEKLLRPGRGPKQAQPQPDTATGDNAALSVDESNDALEADGEQMLNLTEVAIPETLLRRGLAYAQLVDKRQREDSEGATNYDDIDIQSVQLDTIQDKQGELWNRLLEVEEGFPAPLQQPVSIRGIQAW
ncbi:VWA domain-containing protein [Sulfuriflexus mobilis]|uniref:VWA domain-containing protein n=1 Tax=Sulfuriflexus mobilis TaxID=1811807 RepID=UPI000F84200F|nr:VWA domain-containing protein [Sulfuriflexus mobilis]